MFKTKSHHYTRKVETCAEVKKLHPESIFGHNGESKNVGTSDVDSAGIWAHIKSENVID